MVTQEQPVISTSDENAKQTHINSSFANRNRYKILGILISIILVFTIIIVSFIFLSVQATVGNGAELILILIRIAFIIFATPVAIVLFFVGHRIDDVKNRAEAYHYPILIEILGITIGIYLGWTVSTIWVLIITISQGTLWTNPTLYIPFPVITPLVTYLCFKAAQFIYSLFDKKAQRSSLRMPLIAFVLVLPLLIYSIYTIFQLYNEASYQNQVTLTNFKEVRQGNNDIFTADMYVPQSDEYNIIATVGSSSHTVLAGILRLNGVENIDGLNNFILTKGDNKFIFYPNNKVCSSNTSTSVSFDVRKVLAYRFTIAQAKVISENVTCGK